MIYSNAASIWCPISIILLTGIACASCFEYDNYNGGNRYLSIRAKRHIQIDDPGLTLLNETIIFKNATVEKINHKYYEVSYHPPDEQNFAHYWFDVDKLAIKYNFTQQHIPPQLNNSYRRAVGKELGFEFPFYGHMTKTLTIATGGFCYIGEQMHSWLAATQYIAPFMANFDTTPENATIMQVDTGEVFIVEWRNVVVRHQQEVGSFTFQVSLHKNGTIWFVYKNIQSPPNEVSDAHHPLKSGLSDAYLFEHDLTPLSKKIIYEYHRIQVDMTKIQNHTVIELVPEPTCIMIDTCSKCTSADLQHFNCSWCPGTQNESPFCSDVEGLHRKRQQWIKANCKEQKNNAYCTTTPASEKSGSDKSVEKPVKKDKSLENMDEEEENEGGKQVQIHRNTHYLNQDMSVRKQDVNTRMGSGGMALLIITVLCCVTLVGWVVYAYYNPHTASGQLLIRYRPSRWRLVGDHSDAMLGAQALRTKQRADKKDKDKKKTKRNSRAGPDRPDSDSPNETPKHQSAHHNLLKPVSTSIRARSKSPGPNRMNSNNCGQSGMKRVASGDVSTIKRQSSCPTKHHDVPL